MGRQYCNLSSLEPLLPLNLADWHPAFSSTWTVTITSLVGRSTPIISNSHQVAPPAEKVRQLAFDVQLWESQAT